MRILKGWEFLLLLRGCRLVQHVVAESQCLIWDPAFAAVSMHTGWYLLPGYCLFIAPHTQIVSLLLIYLYGDIEGQTETDHIYKLSLQTRKVNMQIGICICKQVYVCHSKVKKSSKESLLSTEKTRGNTLGKGKHLVSISNSRQNFGCTKRSEVQLHKDKTKGSMRKNSPEASLV